ncbi:hypothetical protein QQ045_007315 [Rhodiola kirilowii]
MSTNWSTSEDVQLCISYYRQSDDPISGSRQKVDKLWEKIHIDFQQNWVRGDHEVRTIERSQATLASRFAKLKPILVFWGSCISYARRNPESGCNLQDEKVLFEDVLKKIGNPQGCGCPNSNSISWSWTGES